MMIKKLLSYVKEYKLVSFLTPLMMALEVLMEIIIPLVMAKIIDKNPHFSRQNAKSFGKSAISNRATPSATL